MPTKVTRRSPRKKIDLTQVVQEVRQYRVLDKQVKTISKQQDKIKVSLKGAVDALGEPDAKGSLWIEFDEPVEDVTALKHERRVQQLLNEERAERILTARGLLEDCQNVDIRIDADKMDVVLEALRAAGLYDEVVTTTTSIAEDKVMAAYADGTLSESDIDKMFTEKITWAFKPITLDRPEQRA